MSSKIWATRPFVAQSPTAKTRPGGGEAPAHDGRAVANPDDAIERASRFGHNLSQIRISRHDDPARARSAAAPLPSSAAPSAGLADSPIQRTLWEWDAETKDWMQTSTATSTHRQPTHKGATHGERFDDSGPSPSPSASAGLSTLLHNERFDTASGQMVARPKEAGPVKITMENVPHVSGDFPRTARVEGVVVPTVTKGRPGAPEPSHTGFQISGNPDLDKGHLGGLELGFPNTRENIVGQYSHYQESGEWRQQEKSTLKQAEREEARGQASHLSITPHYKQYRKFSVGGQGYDAQRWASRRSLSVPTGHTVTSTPISKKRGRKPQGSAVEWTQEQAQNRTDDMMALRSAQAFGEDMSGYSDWNPSARGGKGAFKKGEPDAFAGHTVGPSAAASEETQILARGGALYETDSSDEDYSPSEKETDAEEYDPKEGYATDEFEDVKERRRRDFERREKAASKRSAKRKKTDAKAKS